MAAKPTEVIFLGIKVGGVMYQTGDEDLPKIVHEKTAKALLRVCEHKKFMAKEHYAG